MSRKAELNKKMKAWLEIKHNNYDDYWDVKVTSRGKEIFYKKCLFKCSAWLSFFVWKHVTRKIHFGEDVYKEIELKGGKNETGRSNKNL